MRQNECYTVVNSKPVQNVVFQLFSIRPKQSKYLYPGNGLVNTDALKHVK